MKIGKKRSRQYDMARMNLQLTLWQRGADNVYFLMNCPAER